MTVETNITGTWTASETGWHEFTLWGSGAGGAAEGGGGGSSGCRVTKKVLITAGQQFTITRGATGAPDGHFSQVERSGVLAKAMGGVAASGATGGVSVTTGCVGDVITAGGSGTNYNAGTDTGGNGGAAPGGGAGGSGVSGDDGGTGVAPGGGGAGGAVGCIAGNGALGRVNVEYPVSAPASGEVPLGFGFGSILGDQ